MAHTLEFRDHEQFHRQALHIVGFCALAGLAGWGAASLSTQSVIGVDGIIPLLAAALGFGSIPETKRSELRLLAGLALLCAVGVALVLGGAPFWLQVSANAGGAAYFIHRFGSYGGPSKNALALAACGASVLLAYFVWSRLGQYPTSMVQPLAAVAFGLVGALALVPRHLRVRHDPVRDAWSQCDPKLDDELGPLMERTLSLWDLVSGSHVIDPKTQQSVEKLIVAILQTLKQWQELGNELAAQASDELDERTLALEEKVVATTDHVAKAQYLQTLEVLAEQKHAIAQLEVTHGRVGARLHHYLATMERVRFSLVHNRSVDAAQIAEEAKPHLDDLHHLGQDLDCRAQVMGELERAEE